MLLIAFILTIILILIGAFTTLALLALKKGILDE